MDRLKEEREAKKSGMLDQWLEPGERVFLSFVLHILFIYV